MKYSTKVEQKDYEDFYSKLKDGLFLVAQCHLDNLKKTQSATAVGGGDAEVKALDKEIQDLYNELHQDSIISRHTHSENYLPSNTCLDKFVEVLQDPDFHAFESEYHLSKRLKLAEKDWRLAIQLLKHTASTLKILKLGSKEQQSKYVSAWFRMVSVCAQELRHGASIWKELSQKHFQSQILSDSRGKQYVLALGEIYRVG
ncbi:putative Nucleolar GTPase [Melia azedarach]|uniref:Nucleolar GTPase n=1 Tax=Melia azedarach TaxID=155640 RepID=A0ACC1Y885_MELAZ|nr:putative Nucleolar GTPase [Melia azedarach]